ncbi:MAG: GNAT family N-acetyltransferase [Chitinophagales bacterium]|nr:GNAT family N-acetyltransferase [Chitinophagales bacterium]
MRFICKPFADLTLAELYAMMQLRQEVFIVEQNCPYLDADGKDVKSHHLLCYDTDALVAYCRLLPSGVSYEEPSIGRVITAARVRNTGLGKLLMQKAIEHIELLFGNNTIRIGAQAYLKKFYEQFGFEDMQQPYLEDGIPHLIMLRKANAN